MSHGLEVTAEPTEEEIRIGLSGNLCRCTGDTKIVAAVMRAASERRPPGEGGDSRPLPL